MHDKYVRRRRVLIAVLVLISLILLTAYFGEAENSPLHSIQRGIVEVVTPIQDGASKVFSPIRDLAGWVSSTIHAKSQNSQLQAEANQARKVEAAYQTMENQNAQLRGLMGLDNRLNLQNYGPVTADVTGYNPQVWYEELRLGKGSGAGIQVGDPVISQAGLVGKVSSVGSNYAIVAALSSPKYGAGVAVWDNGKPAFGTLAPETGNPTTLQVIYLPGDAQINEGDVVSTSGFTDPTNRRVRSLYPPGIPVGKVTNFNQNTLINNGTVYVSPFVNLRSTTEVQVLTKSNG